MYERVSFTKSNNICVKRILLYCLKYIWNNIVLPILGTNTSFFHSHKSEKISSAMDALHYLTNLTFVFSTTSLNVFQHKLSFLLGSVYHLKVKYHFFL